MDLIKYIASDGDLCETVECEASEEGYNVSDLREPNDEELVDLKPTFSDENLRKTSISSENSATNSDSGVPYLVEEAINDTTFIKPPKKRCKRAILMAK